MRSLILLSLLAAAACWGQELENFNWWDSPISQNLDLTAEQQQQIRVTVREYRNRLIEQRASVQKAEAAYADAMADGLSNDAASRDAIDKLVAARGDLLRSVSQMSLKLRTVLTPQQWQNLQRARRTAVPGRGAPIGAARKAAAPPLRSPADQAARLNAARRARIREQLRQLDARLNQAGNLTEADRLRILEQLREIERTLQ
jgi:Spy/CpxP family protein refolding chaperone